VGLKQYQGLEVTNMRKLLFLPVIVLLLALFAIAASAQASNATGQYDAYVKLLRQDLRSDKKQFLAQNLTLTDAEATKFWPVYDQYSAELSKLWDVRVALIKEYAMNYDKLTHETAASLNQRSIDLDASITKLRQKYVPIVGGVLPGKKAALFFQLEKRIGLIIDLQLAADIPLVVQ
jgi:hypothetical protein